MSNSPSFRSDVEGLRALAVLSVLAFHFGGSSVVSGGFVGVDVFFVISGYLITRNIFAQVCNQRFSLREFYIRRIRRLFPALLFTIALTVSIGILISSPANLEHIGESAIASVFSVSNLYFWNQSGYFDSSAIQKPLLHTWSLAVEEQFYLLWPMIVVLLARHIHERSHAVATLLLLAALSFWAAEVALEKDPAGAFYLTHNRIGEFALGAICAWLPARIPVRPVVRQAFVLLGLGFVLYAVFGYSEEMRFPGLTAILPSLGAALLIQFGGTGFSKLLFSNALMVGIGRISYSLYLAHWPVYVFFRQSLGDEVGIITALLITAVSFTLAIAMYRYVEKPYRIRSLTREPIMSTPIFFKRFAVLAVCLLAVSTLVWAGRGWAWRFPGDLTLLASEAESEKDARFDPYRERCFKNRKNLCKEPKEGVNVFVIGDSHGPDAFNALVTQYPQYHYVLHSLAGCPPLIRENYDLLSAKHPNRDGCIARNEELLYSNKLARADLIVINTVFLWYKPEHLSLSIEQIRKQSDAPIIVLGNYLFFSEDLPDIIVAHGSTKMDAFYKKKLASHSLAFEEELRALSKTLRFTYVSKRDLFCKGESAIDCPLMFGEKLFTYDRHHLSLAGARELGTQLQASHGELLTRIGKEGIGKNSL